MRRKPRVCWGFALHSSPVLTLVLTNGSIRAIPAHPPRGARGKHQATAGPPGEGVGQSAAALKVDGLPKTKKYNK